MVPWSRTLSRMNLAIQKVIKTWKVHQIGKGKNRPILVTLKYPKEKGLIFKNATKLQDCKNECNQPYRVEDHLPP